MQHLLPVSTCRYIPILLLTFRHKRPGAKSGEFRASHWTGVAAPFGRLHSWGKGSKMKKFVMSVVAAATMCGGAAIAADMPVKARPAPVAVVSPWDWAFGGALMSDYNFRGISQSNRGPSVTAYSETPLQRQFELPALPRQPVLGGDAADQPDRRGRHLRRRPLHAGPGHPRHRRHVLLVSARAAVRLRRAGRVVPDLSERQRDAQATPTSGKSTASSAGKS